MKSDRLAIEHVIDTFRQSFDSKDWEAMRTCLAKKIEVDYSSFRGTKPATISNESFVNLRKEGLSRLTTTHTHLNPIVEIKADTARLTCDFEIRRTTLDRKKFLHSFGHYHFGLTKQDGLWKINHIILTVTKSEGDQSIHGAFKN